MDLGRYRLGVLLSQEKGMTQPGQCVPFESSAGRVEDCRKDILRLLVRFPVEGRALGFCALRKGTNAWRPAPL